MIAIVDYGIGNIQSIRNMLTKLNVPCCLASTRNALSQAAGIILPGVGTFDEGILKLKNSGLLPGIEEEVFKNGKPILGICLGMQMMMSSSEEGSSRGLDWIGGEVRRFPHMVGGYTLRIPHIGWGKVKVMKTSELTSSLSSSSRFYFVHSYYVTCEDRSTVLLESEYGIKFDSSIGRDNIYGVQFHPEKSHDFGLEILRSFSELTML